MNRYLFVLIAATLAVLGFVISAESRGEAKSSALVLRNVRLIDGTGKAPVEGATIVVRDGRIEAITTDVSTEVPKDAEVIDVGGKTIMPALIAGHSHLGLVKGTKSASANVTEDNVRRQLERYADYGVGAVVSLGADGDFIYRLRDERNAGKTAGPRIFTAGLGFGVDGGAPPAAAGLDQVHRPATAEEARAQVVALARLKPNFVKIWIDDFNGRFPIKMKREVRRAIIDEAHKQHLRVAAHVYYLSDAKELVTEGIDILAHSIRDQPVDDELIAAMKSRGTFYIATLFLDEAFIAYADEPEWTREESFRKALEPGVEELIKPGVFKPKEGGAEVLARASQNLKRLHEAGVKIGLGTDSGATPLRVQGFGEHRELQLLVAAGLTPLEAIHAATGTNAELLNVATGMGTLEAGKLANFIVLDADPLVDIGNTRKIQSIWFEGKRR